MATEVLAIGAGVDGFQHPRVTVKLAAVQGVEILILLSPNKFRIFMSKS